MTTGLARVLETIRKGTRAQVEAALVGLDDINAVAPVDGSPLHVAVGIGDLEAAELLISRGADVNRCANGEPPLLRVSAEKGEVGAQLLRLLLASGADVDGATDQGVTLLMRLATWDPARKRTIQAATILVDAGADPRRRDESGETALHCAAQAGHAELVALLIARGADPHARSWRYLGGEAMHQPATPFDLTDSSVVAEQLRAAMAISTPQAEPPHGTSLDALLPLLRPHCGRRLRIGTEDALSYLQDEREHHVVFFAWNEIEADIRSAFLRAHCRSFTETMIPFAIVGTKALHRAGVSLDALPTTAVFGTLFWELAIGNGERCPFWYWLSPGKGVERMTRVDHALDALGLIT